MSQIYYVCHNGNPELLNVSLSAHTTCYLYTTYNSPYLVRIYKQTYRFTLDVASNEDVRVYYSYTTTASSGWIGSPPNVINTYYNTQFIDIPAGSTYKDLTITCNENTQGSSVYNDVVNDNYAILPQSPLPWCVPVDPGCGLEIVSLTSNTPSSRGESDGSIDVVVSGATGATVTYKINGVTDTTGTNPTGHTFTGLTSGNYSISVVEGNCFDEESILVLEGEFRTGDFIVNDLAEMQAVENPIILQLQTALNSLNPAYSKSVINVTGTTITGITITFNLVFPIQYNAEFISKGYPDRTNYFIETYLLDEVGVPQGTNSNTEIATSLAECIQADSIISRYYYVSNSGTSITLTAKEYGVNFDLTTGNTTIVGSGISIATITSGVALYDGQLSGNYSLYTEVFVNTDLQYGDTPDLSTYKRVAELELPYDKSNRHRFDLAPILKNFVNSDKFDFNFTGFTTLPNMDTTYYCKYGEKYPLIVNTNTKKKRYKGTTPVKYAINSALDFESSNTMSTYLGSPISSGSTTYSGITFLNTAPNPKYIARNSKEFLYFILKKEYPNALELKGDIYFYNGTSQTGITFITISTLTGATNFGGVTLLACGYNELGLSAYENSGNTKIRRVDFAVWQTDTGNTTTQLTETRSYLLEIDEQPQKYDVAFLNKLGTYETYSFVGEVVEDQQVERETYQKPFDVDVTGAAPLGFEYNSVYNTKYRKVVTVNSGTVDEDTYYYIMQILQSNKIYNYSNPHENFITVINQVAQKSTNSNEYTVQIQFMETIEENNVQQ